MHTWEPYDETGEERLLNALMHGDPDMGGDDADESTESLLDRINAWIDLHRTAFWSLIACGVFYIAFAVYWSVR